MTILRTDEMLLSAPEMDDSALEMFSRTSGESLSHFLVPVGAGADVLLVEVGLTVGFVDCAAEVGGGVVLLEMAERVRQHK